MTGGQEDAKEPRGYNAFRTAPSGWEGSDWPWRASSGQEPDQPGEHLGTGKAPSFQEGSWMDLPSSNYLKKCN